MIRYFRYMAHRDAERVFACGPWIFRAVLNDYAALVEHVCCCGLAPVWPGEE